MLSGDDLAKNEFTSPAADEMPSYITVYYTALTDTEEADPSSRLATDTQNALKLKNLPSYRNPYFADGAVALAFDAAHALYQAARQASEVRYGVASSLRCVNFTYGATGSVWFTNVSHGIVVYQVTSTRPDPRIVARTTATGSTCLPPEASTPQAERRPPPTTRSRTRSRSVTATRHRRIAGRRGDR